MKKSRIFAIILLISLALNLFLGGIFVGKFSGHKFQRHNMQPRLHWIIQSLPEASQIKIKPLMQKYDLKTEAQILKIRQARKEVHKQLTASDFNKETLSQSLAILRQETEKTQQHMHMQLLEIVSQLNTTERQQLSKATHRKPRWQE
ncbi:MAG: periplasmic heavy metal sensor [Candidatus Marithrix sp.]